MNVKIIQPKARDYLTVQRRQSSVAAGTHCPEKVVKQRRNVGYAKRAIVFMI